MKVHRCSWHSAGLLDWSFDSFSVIKYSYMLQIKYTEASLSNNTRKLLWCEITKMLIAVEKKKKNCVIYYNFWHSFVPYSLQCFDAVGWAAGRAFGL